MTRSNSHIKPSGVVDEISLKELILIILEWWRYLLSKWPVILIFGLTGGIIGLIYAVNKKATYIATTTFVLEESGGGSGLGQYAGMASMLGINIGGGGGLFSGDNILELYKSRNMIQKALLSKANFDDKPQLLIDRYIDFNE